MPKMRFFDNVKNVTLNFYLIYFFIFAPVK